MINLLQIMTLSGDFSQYSALIFVQKVQNDLKSFTCTFLSSFIVQFDIFSITHNKKQAKKFKTLCLLLGLFYYIYAFFFTNSISVFQLEAYSTFARNEFVK